MLNLSGARSARSTFAFEMTPADPILEGLPAAFAANATHVGRRDDAPARAPPTGGDRSGPVRDLCVGETTSACSFIPRSTAMRCAGTWTLAPISSTPRARLPRHPRAFGGYAALRVDPAELRSIRDRSRARRRSLTWRCTAKLVAATGLVVAASCSDGTITLPMEPFVVGEGRVSLRVSPESIVLERDGLPLLTFEKSAFQTRGRRSRSSGAQLGPMGHRAARSRGVGVRCSGRPSPGHRSLEAQGETPPSSSTLEKA
jgi:hypothetical protein